MSSNRYLSDSQEMYVEVELDHVFIGDLHIGVGDELTDPETIQHLRDALSWLLIRLGNRDVVESQR